MTSPQAQSLSLMLRRSAARHGDKAALIFGDETWSYAAFDRIVDELAAGLLDLGVAPGDRIAILARNSHAFLAIRFAAARIAAVLVPVNVMLGAGEIAYILDHAEARLLFVDAALAPLAREANPATVEATFIVEGDAPAGARGWRDLLVPGAAPGDRADADDLLQIIYTSGTESRPKGAMLTHAAVLWQYQSCLFDCGWTPDTVALHALPLFHCAALDAMAGPALLSGATSVIAGSPAPDQVLPLIERHRVTSFFAPPTVWIALLRSPLFAAHDLSSLAKCYYGASIMPVAIIEELAARFPGLRLWNLYGQTEIAPVATVLGPADHATRPGSAGRPTLHVLTRVVDDDMRDVAVGEIGEVVHRSPQLLTGYWRQPELSDAAFAGGWFHSGDLATIDADGFITIVDRKKDMIKTGGENVSSREVEEAIYTHPHVSEVAVIGLPDPRWIEAVTAFVVRRAGAEVSAADVEAHCATRLAGFKRPKRIVFVDDLPRNASGKILKQRLRQLSDAMAGHDRG
ncbi:fatty acyl-CoA synthetase [Sphingomonas sp.]|uniref:fatty acyl-CoA synthetase n=1 Tax=Sphingomonas sp. TaxID=28214 RepID=UPI00257AECF3|nr:fatty acyl-CoA synthetase [Sphingomonas sp.]